MKKILLAAGGRPGSLLLAPLYDALNKNASYQPVAILAAPEGSEPISHDLAASFGMVDAFQTISLPAGSPVSQLAAAMTGMEKIMLGEQPDLVMVCGSDNVALGAAITAAKLGLKVAAADAGLRSYQRTDADEVNRVVIDAMAEFHFVSEHSGEYNLINEGVADEKVFFSGNLAIDSLVRLMEEANKLALAELHGVKPKKYALLLISPAVPFSSKEPLEMILRLAQEITGKTTLLMPLTAGLATLLHQHDLFTAFSETEGLKMIDPPNHAALLGLLRDSLLLLTDTEELQAESTVMNVPCLTMMDSSARPATIEIGTNALVGSDEEEIISSIHELLHPGSHQHLTSRSKIPEKWDGAAASRIIAVLDRVL